MLEDYIIKLDNIAKAISDKEVSEKGIEEYLNQKLHYLDATRKLSDGLRPEQTISFIYRYDVSTYLYAVDKYITKDKDKWINKLKEVHEANLAYEENNPPIVYDKKTHKAKSKHKYREAIIPGFEKPKKESKVEAKLKGLSIKLNLIKPNEII